MPSGRSLDTTPKWAAVDPAKLRGYDRPFIITQDANQQWLVIARKVVTDKALMEGKWAESRAGLFITCDDNELGQALLNIQTKVTDAWLKIQMTAGVNMTTHNKCWPPYVRQVLDHYLCVTAKKYRSELGNYNSPLQITDLKAQMLKVSPILTHLIQLELDHVFPDHLQCPFSEEVGTSTPTSSNRPARRKRRTSTLS